MAFSINTNMASLQAQSYLRSSSEFQAKTINRVTSGLRIVSSGDDAAGLAIANGFRSDEAVLTQGIRNANDGLSTLQTIDGGMNNISQLLDRARTLATQSASGTFTGGISGRAQLNSEFQSVMTEIDRQAQSIGLDTGGEFAKSLSVFIGGGRANGTSAITNGSVAVDLSTSTVDTKSLGLKGYTAGYQQGTQTTGFGSTDSGFYDLGASAKTSVKSIMADGAGNAAFLAGANNTITFKLSGPGFSGDTVSVNLNGVNDTASLVTAVNAGIANAAASDASLKQTNIQASIHTGTDGAQQLRFSSSTAAFTVAAGDLVANAFLGNFSAGQTNNGDNLGTAGTGAAVTPGTTTKDVFMAQGDQQYGSTFATMVHRAAGDDDRQTITFTALDTSGAPQTVKVDLAAGATTDMTAALAATAINTALQATNNSALQGIVATAKGDNSAITFSSAASSKFTVSFGIEGDVSQTALDGATGFTTDKNTVKTSASVGLSGTGDISTQTGAQSAVTALAAAVSRLGNSQAVVGKGQNNFNYASNLAQSQLTNLAAAESRIRDADLANEAANLSKAQILVQAGTAALAQANSAPQAILSLLRG